MFNKQQLEAITCRDRFIFVNAGAGSGKTTVMIARIQALLSEGILEDQILGLTFSREAAHQMKQRLNKENVFISTFHSFCYQHLKDNQVAENLHIFHPDFLLKVSLYKNKLSKKPIGYHRYKKYLKKNNMIDYDDMLIEFIKLNDSPKFKHILIDEFQDTNYLQMQVVSKLITNNTHVFVVGDPDQSIYRFRGAMPSVIQQFVKYYQAKVLTLDMNYRSDKNILNIANQLIKNNMHRIEKTLKSYSNHKGHIEIILCHDKTNQLETLLEFINNLTYKSFAILSRTHHLLYELKLNIHETIPMFLQHKIKLLTLHESKGLEFDVVCIIGIDEKTLPHHLSVSKESIEEERRLFYVGITRAKHQLYFIHHKHQDQNKNVKLSKFMLEISQNQQFKAIK
jgi:DNA helicase II / ATP-dependent DNA helicase PcrA